RILLRRDGRGDAPLLPDQGARRLSLPCRHRDHGRQHLADYRPSRLRGGPRRPAGPGSGRGRGNIPMSLFDQHKVLETNAIYLLFAALIVIAIGGLVEIVPLFYLKSTIETVDGVRPYTPLELAGRDIYVREGCYLCHSQMIRALRDEVERYGHYSLAAES